MLHLLTQQRLLLQYSHWQYSHWQYSHSRFLEDQLLSRVYQALRQLVACSCMALVTSAGVCCCWWAHTALIWLPLRLLRVAYMGRPRSIHQHHASVVVVMVVALLLLPLPLLCLQLFPMSPLWHVHVWAHSCSSCCSCGGVTRLLLALLWCQ